MTQWVFVIAAYAVVGLSIAALVISAWLSMRSAEADAEAVKRRS